MTMSMSFASHARRNSSALPLPTNMAASGLARRPVSVTAGWAPALCASRLSSSRLASKSILPKSMPTSAALIKLVDVKMKRPGCVACGRRSTGRDERLGRFGIGVEIHRTGRHDSRDSVLVDHLGHRIPEQHDVLVERFNVPLKLDAVDQIDRDRHVLFTQCVQKRVL